MSIDFTITIWQTATRWMIRVLFGFEMSGDEPRSPRFYIELRLVLRFGVVFPFYLLFFYRHDSCIIGWWDVEDDEDEDDAKKSSWRIRFTGR